jgi:branched-chain amino acid transport system ATP-binding protein
VAAAAEIGAAVTPALEVRDVKRAFGGIQAVGGVSFEVAEQEVVGIIGPNGSGKSTLFNLVTGVYRPDAGRVVLRGTDVTGRPAHRIARAGLGRTFQIPGLFVNMTVRENLLTAAVHGDWKSAPGRAAEVLAQLSIEHVADDLAGTLSGGQQRLLEFGRVLMAEPRVILLDEVTAGVHPRLRDIILGNVARLRDGGRTFVVIEHDMELIRAVCDRVIVMDAGQIVAQGPFAKIAGDQHVVEAYLGRPVQE